MSDHDASPHLVAEEDLEKRLRTTLAILADHQKRAQNKRTAINRIRRVLFWAALLAIVYRTAVWYIEPWRVDRSERASRARSAEFEDCAFWVSAILAAASARDVEPDMSPRSTIGYVARRIGRLPTVDRERLERVSQSLMRHRLTQCIYDVDYLEGIADGQSVELKRASSDFVPGTRAFAAQLRIETDAVTQITAEAAQSEEQKAAIEKRCRDLRLKNAAIAEKLAIVHARIFGPASATPQGVIDTDGEVEGVR